MTDMNERVVAIHQPNFLPWLGYFEKIARSDVFILLDNVQFPKKGGSWTNRVRLLVSGRPKWVTVPVSRSYHGVRRIDEIEVDDTQPWRRKILETVRTSYARAPHFTEVFSLIESWLSNPTTRIAELNIVAIRDLAQHLGFETKDLVLASELDCSEKATELLICLTTAVHGTTYLCGGGADYQDDAAFAAAGLSLRYQDFEHPEYSQTGEEFHPGLSIVDALMWQGFAGTAELLLSEVKSKP